MKQADYENLDVHLKSARADLGKCPLCHADDWQADGPIASYAAEGSHEDPIVNQRKAVPMVMIFCGQCFFTRLFLWSPIRDGQVKKVAEIASGEKL